jgi:uncharacterized protein
MKDFNNSAISPVDISSRIISIDVLRGFAVLGILIMNIQSFSMPTSAFINPVAYSDLTGINKWVWLLSDLFASGKFMSIFSLLFGAGILLFTDKALAKGRRGGPLHYRRMLWLFIFGMIHAYLIWYGDILVAYSLCGLLAFVFRKKSPRTLVILTSVFFIVPILLNSLFYFTIPFWPDESLQNTMESWNPDAETIAREVAIMRGSWLEQMEKRVPMAMMLQTMLFFMGVFWRVMSMMLLGMALYKWRILSAEKSTGFYTRLAIIGLLMGYSLSGMGIYLNSHFGWEMAYSMFMGVHFNYVGSVAVALGYIAIIMLICKTAKFSGFKNSLGAVGRMAFTNYIFQSIICTFIFYGHGLGLFGSVERKYQFVFVVGVWILILVISPIWLKYYRFGPLEWLWRSLTYWRWQPFRKRSSQTPAV